MIVRMGYKCKKCGKIYAKTKHTLPVFCKKCGADLILERYYYNRTRFGEETRETNMFGGYDYVKSELSELAIPVKIKKNFLRWEVIE